MKFIKQIVKRITKHFEQKKPLGRWANDYCDVKTSKKIDWSNEDHCGPCGTRQMPNDIKKLRDP
jgi:hypothetical protein